MTRTPDELLSTVIKKVWIVSTHQLSWIFRKLSDKEDKPEIFDIVLSTKRVRGQSCKFLEAQTMYKNASPPTDWDTAQYFNYWSLNSTGKPGATSLSVLPIYNSTSNLLSKVSRT